MAENLVICVGIDANKRFSSLIADTVPDLGLLGSTQCFPMYIYDEVRPEMIDVDISDENIATWRENGCFVAKVKAGFCEEGDMLKDRRTGVVFSVFKSDLAGDYQIIGVSNYAHKKLVRRDAITDDGLAHFADYYAAQVNSDTISKEDLFYYIYGLLHSEDYRTRYADNLSKELPRIPRVKTYADFKHFSDAGRQLAHYHLNYESVEAYPVSFNTNFDQLTDADFYVTKMKFGKGKGDDRHDKTTVIYNHKITLSGIPLEAYDYVVNGKAALDWVMERQCVKTDKDRGIINDANDWAIETMHNPRYPLELFQRVITVSLATLKIVQSLPKLDIE